MRIFNILRKKLPENKVIWCIAIPYTKEQFYDCYAKNSDFIESLQPLFGTNDKELLWKKYESTANRINNCVTSLKEKGVTIKSIYSPDDFLGIFNHTALIITAHRHRYLNCFDFMGNAVSFNDVVDKIPNDYNGIIDISSCFSASFVMEWKKKRIQAKYIAVKTEANIDLRLFIYEHVIRYMIHHPNKTYLDSLTKILNRIESASNKNIKYTNNRKDISLGGIPVSNQHSENNNSDYTMSASAFAPSEAVKGNSIMIQIYVYKNNNYIIVNNEAIKIDEDATVKCSTPLGVNLKENDRITIKLISENLKITDSKELVWYGQTAKTFFIINIPNDLDNTVKPIFEIFLSVNNIPIGELFFTLKIVSSYSNENTLSQIIYKQYKKVFISYSHLDKNQVIFLYKGLELGNVEVFFDHITLNWGDVFPEEIQQHINSADAFILCWSQHAKKSDYVRKELEYALRLAYPYIEKREEAKLRILPMIIEPPAELPDNIRDVYHFITLYDYNHK